MAPDIAALKLKHAKHILEVVRGAEKKEAVRQRKLRHATSKANFAYLQKRFDAERKQDQTHIAGLVHDANAVEAALRRCPPKRHHRQRDGSAYTGGDSHSCGGRVASVVQSVGTNRSSKSNAYVEPEPKEDPNFISLDQMRFMKYVYAHVDDQKAAKAHARLITQLVGAEELADKHHDRRKSRIRARGDKEATSAASGKADAGNFESSGSRREQIVLGGISSQPHGGSGNVGANRQRLLEQKREILLEMKGVVCRQAEALDRLVEGSANVNRAAQAGGRGRGSDSKRGRSFQGSYVGSTKSKPSSARYEGTESGSKSCRARSKAAGHQRTRRASCPDVPNLVVHNTPTASTVGGGKPLPLPRPPENATSAFLARGGRWGGESRQGTSRRGRDSLASASSASYATYCNRSSGGGRAAALKCGLRPAAVPALPLL